MKQYTAITQWVAEQEYNDAFKVLDSQKSTAAEQEAARNQCRVLAGSFYLWYSKRVDEEYRTAMWLRRAYLHFNKEDKLVWDGSDPMKWYKSPGKALLGKRRLAAVLQGVEL